MRVALVLLGLVALLVAAAEPWLDRAAALHLLRRTTFGPTPALLAEVQGRGAARWLDEQLHPPRGPEPALEPLLGHFPFHGRTMLGLYRELYRISPPEDPRVPMGRRNIQLPAVARNLVRHRVLLAAETRWQLREVLTDFWFNHFYVDVGKSEVTAFGVPAYEAELRRHALGRFRDLLEVSARSPAMLDYLDNASSSASSSGGGLNENYGRELLELHTVGLSAGYTEEDVREVARCFTGWTFTDDRGAGDEGLRARRLWSFRFSARDHAPGARRVLGHEIRALGEGQGEAVLDLLARHPATARFVSRKLAVRLLGEEVSEATVASAAAVFRETDGDIARVVEHLLTCEEFGRHRGTRYKTPLEFVVSALRVHPAPADLARELRDPHPEEFQPAPPASPMDGAGVPPAEAFRVAFEALGTPYGCKAPTGWADANAAWISTSGLHYRGQIAALLARGSQSADVFLLGEVSAETRRSLAEAVDAEEAVTRAFLSPEFQYR